MAHPSDYLGKAGIVVIDANTGAFEVPTNADGDVTKHIVAIQNMGATRDGTDDTFTVKGKGIIEYRAFNSAAGTHVDSNGVVLEAGHAAGYYEALDTTGVAMEIAVGATVYGKFTSVDATDGDKAVLYLG